MPPVQPDLGEFIVSELARHSISVPRPEGLPTIPAEWELLNQDIPEARRGFAVMARGCCVSELDKFFRALLRRFQTPDSQQFEDGSSFTFHTFDGDYFFSAAADSFVATCPSIVIAVGPRDDAVVIEMIRR